MVAGGGADAVGIRYKQGVGGIGEAAGRAENGVAGIGILRGEGRLPDHEARGLPSGKSSRSGCCSVLRLFGAKRLRFAAKSLRRRLGGTVVRLNRACSLLTPSQSRRVGLREDCR